MNNEQLNTVKSRIKKLLALSKSPNENEAALAISEFVKKLLKGFSSV